MKMMSTQTCSPRLCDICNIPAIDATNNCQSKCGFTRSLQRRQFFCCASYQEAAHCSTVLAPKDDLRAGRRLLQLRRCQTRPTDRKLVNNADRGPRGAGRPGFWLGREPLIRAKNSLRVPCSRQKFPASPLKEFCSGRLKSNAFSARIFPQKPSSCEFAARREFFSRPPQPRRRGLAPATGQFPRHSPSRVSGAVRACFLCGHAPSQKKPLPSDSVKLGDECDMQSGSRRPVFERPPQL